MAPQGSETADGVAFALNGTTNDCTARSPSDKRFISVAEPENTVCIICIGRKKDPNKE
jgi:hypothetical protein